MISKQAIRERLRESIFDELLKRGISQKVADEHLNRMTKSGEIGMRTDQIFYELMERYPQKCFDEQPKN